MVSKPLGIVKVFYTDKAGNRVVQDLDGKICCINRKNNIVRHNDAVKLLRRAGFRVKDNGSKKKLIAYSPGSMSDFGINL